MKIVKSLVVFSLIFAGIGKVEAERAFSFQSSAKMCVGRSFSTSTLSLTTPIIGLDIDGWYVNGQKVSDGPTTSFFISSSGVSAVLHSSFNGVEYRDPITIEAVQKPQISMVESGTTVCSGSTVTVHVDSKTSVDNLVWVVQTPTGLQRYPEGSAVVITDFTSFTVQASNNYCDDLATASYYVDVTPVVDTMTMGINTMPDPVEICPGCTRNLDDFVTSYGADEMTIESLIWDKSGGGTFDPAAVGAPALGASDIYNGLLTVVLTKTNECGPRTRRFVDLPIRVMVTRSNCQLNSQWANPTYPNIPKLLLNKACTTHYFDIINPQRDGFDFTDANITVQSANNYNVSFAYEIIDGMRVAYRFASEPSDDDEITITVTYVNKCSDEQTFTYTDVLTFEIDPTIRPKVTQRYCKADTLALLFSAVHEDLYINSVDFEEPHDADFRNARTWENSGGGITQTQYNYKDTVHEWDKANDFDAYISYTYCDVPKKDTVRISPVYSDDCYPEIEMGGWMCKGDTNWLSVTEKRWPVAYIKTFEWVFPDQGFQPFEYFDTVAVLNEWMDTVGISYKLKFISYVSDADNKGLRYKLTYCEGGVDKPIDLPVTNLTIPDCNPWVEARREFFCRGDSTSLTVTMTNLNGRIKRIEWLPQNGRHLADSLGAKFPTWIYDQTYYDYRIRLQKSGYLNARITYTYGDSVATYDMDRQLYIRVDDCHATMNQYMSMQPQMVNADKSYCGGESAYFVITPWSTAVDKIIGLNWDQLPISEVLFDSISETEKLYYHYVTSQQDTTFTFNAHVIALDYFKDTVRYDLPDRMIIRPYPRIWTQETIDVCESDSVNLEDYVDYGLIKPPPNGVLWHLPPFNGNPYVRLQFGDSIRLFVADATPVKACLSMGNIGLVKDTIILRWNNPPTVAVHDFIPTCINDTVELRASFDVVSTITWVKNNDTIFRNREWGEVLQDVVTESVWYRGISTTACGSTVDEKYLTAIPAAKLSAAALDTSVCVYDSAHLYTVPNPEIVGVPEWYIYDTVFQAPTAHFQVRDSLDMKIIVMAMGANGCKGKDSFMLNSLPLPAVKVSLAGRPEVDSSVCEKMTSEFTLQVNAEGAMDYYWLLPAEFEGNTTEFLEVPPIVDTTTVYRVEGTDANGCKNRASFYVTVIKPDENMFEDNIDTACERQSYQFTAAPVDNMTYFWQMLDGSMQQTPTLQIDNMTTVDAGIYKLIRLQYGCLDTTDFTLKIKPTPWPEVLNNNSPLCEGTELLLSARTYTGSEQYWRTPENTIVPSDSVNVLWVSRMDSGTYDFVISLNGCTDSISVDVRVDARSVPMLSIDRPLSYYCDEDPISFSYLPADADLYVLKMPSKRMDTTMSSSIKFDQIHQVDSGTVVLLVNRLTCQDTAYRSIEVRYRPNPKPSYDPQYCADDTIRINVVPESNVTYEWTGPAGFTSKQGNIILNDVNVNQNGKYYLTASSNGCLSYIDTVEVVINPLPVIDMNAYEYLCLGDVLTMDVSRPDATYLWNTGDATSAIQVTEGNRYYAVTITEKDCLASDSAYIEARPKPEFKLMPDTIICSGDQLRIAAGITGVNYMWSTGSTMDYIDASAAGWYSLQAERNACTWTDSMWLSNKFCGTLEMPTAFRPNSEIAVNRIFKSIKQAPKELLEFEMFIYDKWGKLMFQTDDITEGWDGTYDGKECAAAVYVYVIKAKETLQGNDLSMSGTVTLIR